MNKGAKWCDGSFLERMAECNEILAKNLDTLVASYMIQTGLKASEIEFIQKIDSENGEISYSVQKKVNR